MSCCRFDVRLSESCPNASSQWGCNGGRQSEAVQPEFTATSPNQLSFPRSSSAPSLYLPLIFLSPSLFSLSDFSSGCVTQCSARGTASPSPSVTHISSETLCFASSSNRRPSTLTSDQEHVFQSTFSCSRVINGGGKDKLYGEFPAPEM